MCKAMALPHLSAVPTMSTKLMLALVGAHLLTLTQRYERIGHLAAELSLALGQAWHATAEHGGRKAGY